MWLCHWWEPDFLAERPSVFAGFLEEFRCIYFPSSDWEWLGLRHLWMVVFCSLLGKFRHSVLKHCHYEQHDFWERLSNAATTRGNEQMWQFLQLVSGEWTYGFYSIFFAFFFHVCLNNFTVKIKRCEGTRSYPVSLRRLGCPSLQPRPPNDHSFCIFISRVTFWVILSNLFLLQLSFLQLHLMLLSI